MLILGIGFIIYPIYIQFQQGKEIEQLEYSLDMIQSGELGKEDISIDGVDVNDVIRLSIPSIALNQPILASTSAEHLNVALTQIKPKQKVGEGNFTIAGHLSSIDGRHFNRLPEVKIGDEVSVITDTEVYTFEITSSEVIEATDVSVLDDRGKSEITLITCTPSGLKRLAVKGQLDRVETMDTKNISSR